MADVRQMEIGKVANIIKLAGFDITSSRFEGDKIIVSAEKSYKTESREQRSFEMQRLTSMLSAMGWGKSSEASEGTVMKASFELTLKIE